MSRKNLTPVNLLSSASAPSIPTLGAGDTYWNSASSTFFVYDGAAWVAIGAVTASSTDTFTNKSISGSTNTLSNISNSSLTNSTITINGVSVSLGGSTTVTGDTDFTPSFMLGGM